jgi:hypothetical protein
VKLNAVSQVMEAPHLLPQETSWTWRQICKSP